MIPPTVVKVIAMSVKPKFDSNADGAASLTSVPASTPALVSQASVNKPSANPNLASFTRIKPKGEEELRLLKEKQLAEER